MKIKACTKCKTEYPLTAEYFFRDRVRSGGLRSNCKGCCKKDARKRAPRNRKKKNSRARGYRLLYGDKIRGRTRDRKHNLTTGQYDKMLRGQNGVCAICGELEITKQNDRLRALSVDHNHSTGKIRGLLCNKCNSAIGNLCVDDHGIELLCSAISYIKNSS